LAFELPSTHYNPDISSYRTAMDSHNPLTAETREQISICEYNAQTALSNGLMIFFALSPSQSMAVFGIVPRPDPPRQPIALFSLLKRHAVNLFRCEHAHYPRNGELSCRDALARRIEELIMDVIRRFEKPYRGSLQFHASLDEMRAAVREGLADLVNGVPQPIDTPTEPDRRALVDSYIQAELLRTGKRTTRTAIWKAAGYKSASEFERWQRRDSLGSKAADRNFTRIFTEKKPLV
jgi:hypothetical protein